MYITLTQAADLIGVNKNLMNELFRQSGSPAFKAGIGVTSRWLVDDEELIRWLKERSEEFKG